MVLPLKTMVKLEADVSMAFTHLTTEIHNFEKVQMTLDLKDQTEAHLSQASQKSRIVVLFSIFFSLDFFLSLLLRVLRVAFSASALLFSLSVGSVGQFHVTVKLEHSSFKCFVNRRTISYVIRIRLE